MRRVRDGKDEEESAVRTNLTGSISSHFDETETVVHPAQSTTVPVDLHIPESDTSTSVART